MSLIYKGQTIADVGGGSSSEEVYSTEETRIGTWIDGKPLYRRVFSGDSLTASSNVWTGLFDVPDADYLVKCSATVHYVAEKQSTVISNYLVMFSLRNQKLSITLFNSWSGLGNPYTVIIEYTKSTDSGVMS